jgi:limonene-1,2-epoxide hydrolase
VGCIRIIGVLHHIAETNGQVEQGGQTMTEHIALVENFVAAWNRYDLDAVEGMVAPDIFYHNIPMQPYIGQSAFREFIRSFPAVSAKWVIHAIAASGNAVLTERTDQFDLADGSIISIRVMGTFEIGNGKIAK